MKFVTAEQLLERFHMEAHVENGSYLEVHYPAKEPGRAASGAIYYYVSPDEITKFHVIDCDEYWIYTAGSPLEVCSVTPDGEVTTSMLGVDDGCVPLIYFKAGVKFASRHPKKETEGTFLICITVPRFDPKGFSLIEKDEILSEFPQLEAFFGMV